MAFWEFLGYQQDFISSYNGPLGTPKGGPKVQKWVSDADPINIGQLDHYVSFGTQETPKMPFIGSKLHFNCGDHPDGAFWTKSCHFGPSDYLFRGLKARFRSICGLQKGFIC